MSEERKTIAGWVHHLTAPDATLSLEELTALMLLHIRDNVLEMRKAAEHTEGMVGAIDQLAFGLAARSGIPYAASAEVRAALDRQRDEQRRLAAEERQQALGEGNHAV